MAARARNAKGRFVKGHSSKGHSSKALVHTKTKYVTRNAPKAKRKSHRRHRGGYTGGVTLGKVIVAGAALGYLFSESGPSAGLRQTVDKVPGVKTFGAPAVVGAIALGVDHFMYKSPWLRAAGLVGVAAAALTLGAKNKDFKFLGDADDDEFVGDVD
jgi:hypothetical protein